MSVGEDIVYLRDNGISVLHVYELPNHTPAYMVPEKDFGNMVDDWCLKDQGRKPRGYVPDDYFSFLTCGVFRGKIVYEDITPPECYVQQSYTLIGILHDIWCDDVDWWNAEETIALVDRYVMINNIEDTLENYRSVIDAVGRIIGGE